MTSDSAKKRLELYRTMYLVRRTEEILAAEYHPADEMRCPIHFCVGQEATPAALGAVIRRDDVLMSHYRSHGYYLAKGAPLEAMVAEFYGKAAGANGGIAGSMELASHEFNFYSGAIVGGSLFIPLGSAFAQKYRGGDGVSVAVMGDGSFDEGATYEVFNLAALYRLPLLIICENNQYAAHTALTKRMVEPNLAERAQAFGLPAKVIDDAEPEAVLSELTATMAKLRRHDGPAFLQVNTYRFSAHVGPQDDDALAYRPAAEIADRRARDPLIRLRREAGDVAALEAEIDARIHAAIAAAKSAPFPELGAVLAMNAAGTYAPVVRRFLEQSSDRFRGDQPEARLGPF